MITPAYSPTASERVLPRMALDFTTGTLDSRVTVTRSLNTATRVNSSGLVETVNANLPRFDYDPVTLASRGLLIEESRANLLLRSAEFDVSPWFVDNVSVTANSTTAPDGTTTADAIIENLATSNHNINTTATVTVAPHTFSAYVKPNGRSWVRLFVFQSGITANSTWFNVSTGVAGFASAGASNVSIRPAGNGWYRCSITFTPASAGSASFYIAAANADGAGVYAGDNTSGLFIWGAQAELGAFSTSYIPTTSTSLTRNADAVSMTGTNFSSWYNATEGTLQVIGSMNTASTSIFQSFAMLGDANNSLQIFNNLSASRFRGDIYSGGALQKAFTYTAAGAPASGTTYNIIVGLKANDFAMAINGNTVATANSGLMPVSPSALYIGSVNTGAQQIGGYIRKLAYYNQKLTNSEIQAFSK